MTDKEFAAQKKRVMKFWDKYFTAIGMGWWAVEVNWSREREADSSNTIGITHASWEYRQGNVTFFLPTCADLNDEQLEEAVVHEMVHIIAEGIHDTRDDQAREITEYTVTSLARAIVWAYRAGAKQ